jgi:predicted lipid carrier protein YhbT
VQRGQHDAEVVYRLGANVFGAIVAGRLSAQEAFLARHVEIEGDVEKGLKLAVLFDRLVRQCPYPSSAREIDHVSAVPA